MPDGTDPSPLDTTDGARATAEHRSLARWAADCAAHVLDRFEAAVPDDPRPREAVAAAHAWADGELPVGRARSAAFAAHAAARETTDPVGRAVARSAGQAAATAHAPEHAAHAARYAASAVARSTPAPGERAAAAAERTWQEAQLPDLLRHRRDELLGERRNSAGETAAARGQKHTQRMFVAIWPPASAVAHLRDFLAPRRSEAAPELRWQPPERWHITLAFLGDVDPAVTQTRLEKVQRPAVRELRLAGSGTFGPVLWIGVAHDPWLDSLAREVRTALDADDGLFRPHVTVARARGRRAVPTAREAAPILSEYAGPEWIPDSLTLVRSWTGPHPRYEVVARWPLDPAP